MSVAECWNTRKPVLDRHWMDLLTSEGHRLWKRRMQTVGQPVDDAEYARFLFSSKVGEQREEFRAALREWRSAHWEQAALRALDWLPENAKIVARVFIVLSPTATSFYHSEAENAAVFFALDAALSEPQRENLMVHELHHVGYFGLRGHQRAAPALPAIQSQRNGPPHLPRGWLCWPLLAAQAFTRTPRALLKPERAGTATSRTLHRTSGQLSNFFLTS